MANIIYNAGLRDLLVNTKTFDTATYKVLLERSTSSYSPDKDDDSILDAEGLVQITVATYAIQTIGSPTITEVDGSDLVKIDCANPAFGALEAGQTVKAAVVFRDDSGNGIPLLYIDTDSGGLLPRALGGGNFTLEIAAAGLITFAQA